MIDPEKNLHIRELKVRLKPADDDLLRALARKRDIPPAVLARTLLLRELGAVGATTTIRGSAEIARPH